MIGYVWNLILYQPLLNALAFLVSVLPGGDVGLAVILLTILVKVILFPLARKSIESQAEMNVLAPKLQKIKESGATKEEQATQTFELYKKYKVNPFSGCLLLLIQIPIIFALLLSVYQFFVSLFPYYRPLLLLSAFQTMIFSLAYILQYGCWPLIS